jgi:hypothetical protein
MPLWNGTIKMQTGNRETWKIANFNKRNIKILDFKPESRSIIH